MTVPATDFYTRTGRVRGGGKTITVKLAGMEQWLVEAAVNDPRTPYRNTQDLMHDALVHRMHQLTDIYDDGVASQDLRMHTFGSLLDGLMMVNEHEKSAAATAAQQARVG